MGAGSHTPKHLQVKQEIDRQLNSHAATVRADVLPDSSFRGAAGGRAIESARAALRSKVPLMSAQLWTAGMRRRA